MTRTNAAVVMDFAILPLSSDTKAPNATLGLGAVFSQQPAGAGSDRLLQPQGRGQLAAVELGVA